MKIQLVLLSNETELFKALSNYFSSSKDEVRYQFETADFNKLGEADDSFQVLMIEAKKDNPSWKNYLHTLNQRNLGFFSIILSSDISSAEVFLAGADLVLSPDNSLEIIQCLEKLRIKNASYSGPDKPSTADLFFQLDEKKKELDKISFELDRFVYSASHDLRAPLTSVLGLIYLLRAETKMEDSLHLIQLMEDSILKLDCTIKDIVAYSRNNKLELKTEAIEMHGLLDDIISNLRYLESDNFSIKNAIALKSPEIFFSDRDRIQVLLNNLLANSIRYRHPERPAEIRVSVENKAGEIILCVSDNGIGIQKEHFDKIFEMFYRTNESSTGSGLGLYIVRETVLKMGGKIRVNSQLNEGAEFIIHLPKPQSFLN